MEGPTLPSSPFPRDTRLKIALLSPYSSTSSPQHVKAVIALVWPYSSSTSEIALLLAEPDVRLRKSKGQVRVVFHGHVARKVAECRAGIGDAVYLSLEGAEWIRSAEEVATPGKKIEWDLAFESRAHLIVSRGAKILSDIDFIEPFPEPNSSSQARDISWFDRRNGELSAVPATVPEIYTSPAFARSRNRLSGSILDASFDPFVDGDGFVVAKGRKRTKFARWSASWQILDRSPSPPADVRFKDGISEQDLASAGSLNHEGVQEISRSANTVNETAINIELCPPSLIGPFNSLIFKDLQLSNAIPDALTPMGETAHEADIAKSAEDRVQAVLCPTRTASFLSGAGTTLTDIHDNYSLQLSTASQDLENLAKKPPISSSVPGAFDGAEQNATKYEHSSAESESQSRFDPRLAEPGYASDLPGSPEVVGKPYSPEASSENIFEANFHPEAKVFQPQGHSTSPEELRTSQLSNQAVRFSDSEQAMPNTAPLSLEEISDFIDSISIIPENSRIAVDLTFDEQEDILATVQVFGQPTEDVFVDSQSANETMLNDHFGPWVVEGPSGHETVMEDDHLAPRRTDIPISASDCPSEELECAPCLLSLQQPGGSFSHVPIPQLTPVVDALNFMTAQQENNTTKKAEESQHMASPVLSPISPQLIEWLGKETLTPVSQFTLTDSSWKTTTVTDSVETVEELMTAPTESSVVPSLPPSVIQIDPTSNQAQIQQRSQIDSTTEEVESIPLAIQDHRTCEKFPCIEEGRRAELVVSANRRLGLAGSQEGLHDSPGLPKDLKVLSGNSVEETKLYQMMTPGNTQQITTAPNSTGDPVFRFPDRWFPPSPRNTQESLENLEATVEVSGMIEVEKQDNLQSTVTKSNDEAISVRSRRRSPRLSRKPAIRGSLGVVSPYFTPRRTGGAQDRIHPQSSSGYVHGPNDELEDQRRLSNAAVYPDRVANQGASSKVTDLGIHHVGIDKGLTTAISYYTPLLLLSDHFLKTVDILAVCINDSTNIQKASSSPKDFFVTALLTDTSSSDKQGVVAQFFRPYKLALPRVRRGDVMLLRTMNVQSHKRRCVLLSTAGSAWVVFSFLKQQGLEKEKFDVVTAGPPVEYGTEETLYMQHLRLWWKTSGQDANPPRMRTVKDAELGRIAESSEEPRAITGDRTALVTDIQNQGLEDKFERGLQPNSIHSGIEPKSEAVDPLGLKVAGHTYNLRKQKHPNGTSE